jgi:hypothetical protein
MQDVFVSYSHQDTSSVESIVRRLSGRGLTVWWDRRLLGGEDLAATVHTALTASRCAVVAWSRLAQHSLWVKAEANAAREDGKLVQLTLDGTKPPLPFSMLHALDFREDDGSPEAPPMQRLLLSVESVISGSRELPDAKTSWGASLAGFGPAVAIGGASIGLVILVSALASNAARLNSADMFGLASTGMFLLSVLGMAHMLVRVILAFVASRRR